MSISISKQNRMDVPRIAKAAPSPCPLPPLTVTSPLPQQSGRDRQERAERRIGDGIAESACISCLVILAAGSCCATSNPLPLTKGEVRSGVPLSLW